MTKERWSGGGNDGIFDFGFSIFDLSEGAG